MAPGNPSASEHITPTPEAWTVASGGAEAPALLRHSTRCNERPSHKLCHSCCWQPGAPTPRSSPTTSPTGAAAWPRPGGTDLCQARRQRPAPARAVAARGGPSGNASGPAPRAARPRGPPAARRASSSLRGRPRGWQPPSRGARPPAARGRSPAWPGPGPGPRPGPGRRRRGPGVRRQQRPRRVPAPRPRVPLRHRSGGAGPVPAASHPTLK